MNASYQRFWVPEELQPIRLEELAPRVYIPRSPSQPRGRADAGRRHRGRGDGAEPRPGVLRSRGPRWDRGSRRESRRPRVEPLQRFVLHGSDAPLARGTRRGERVRPDAAPRESRPRGDPGWGPSPCRETTRDDGRKIHEQFEDHANVLLRFRNGVNGFVEVNWLTPMKVRKLALTCLKNFVEVDYIEQSVTVSSSTFGPLDPFNLYQIPLEHHTQQIHVRKEEPLKRELQDFLDPVQHERPPLVTGEDAAQTLRVAVAATESHRTGKLVQLL